MRVGPYEVSAEIGRGGMGVVYRAQGPRGDVAVKVLLASDDPEAIARFERERHLLGLLGEPDGFVPLLDAGVASGKPYLVMPFVGGGTLRSRLARGPLPVGEAVALVTALAGALTKAHARGIVHRDLKPENVIFTSDGRPLVADLGLARHFRRDLPGAGASGTISATGSMAGTPGYMAPEQIEDVRRAGPAADVFALGAILFECVSGKRPYGGETVGSYVVALRSGQRPSHGGSEVPPWLEAVALKAIDQDPSARYADAAQLLRALVAKTEAPGRRWFALAALVAVAALGGAVFWLWPAAAPLPAPRPVPVRPPPAKTAPETELEALERLGDAARKANDLGAARDLYRELTGKAPGSARAWLKLGHCCVLPGELVLASTAAENALRLDPGAEAYQFRGYVRGFARDFEGALADDDRTIALQPDNGLAYGHRGECLSQLGDPAGARVAFDRALELDPHLNLTWHLRGMLRRNQGDLAGAIEDFTRALEPDPLYRMPLVDRARARELTGDFAGSVADCEAFIAFYPTDGRVPELRDRIERLRPAVKKP